MTLQLLQNVQLSARFGGTEHGERVRALKKGTNVELKNDKLSALLVERGLAVELKVERK